MLHLPTARAPARTSAVPTEKTHGWGGTLEAGAVAFVGVLLAVNTVKTEPLQSCPQLREAWNRSVLS